jgi:hypothetical protein
MRGATVTLMAVGFAGVLAVAMPARAQEVIEHKSESMRVESAPAPVVKKKETHEQVIEHQAAPAAVEQRSKTVVKKGHDDNDNDDNDDLND